MEADIVSFFHPEDFRQSRYRSICFLRNQLTGEELYLKRDGVHELCVLLCEYFLERFSDDDEVKTPSNYRVPVSIYPLIFILMHS